MSKKELEFVYAYDPKVKMRVVHVVKDGWAISLVTGHKVKIDGYIQNPNTRSTYWVRRPKKRGDKE